MKKKNKTYKYWKSRGKPVKHKLIGKDVYYRPHSESVVKKAQGTHAGKVVGARRVSKGYISLAMKKKGEKRYRYARSRMLTTRKPKKRRRKR